MKPQRPGELSPPASPALCPSPPPSLRHPALSLCPVSPGFRPGIGLGGRAFPGAAAQPGEAGGKGRLCPWGRVFSQAPPGQTWSLVG